MKYSNKLCALASGLVFVIPALVQKAHAECLQSLSLSFDASAVEYSDNGTVVDHKTQLMWSRCVLGYQWEAGQCREAASQVAEFDWYTALQQANQAELAGFDDWRLPNKNELETLVERSCWSPAINEDVFPSTLSEAHWTSSPSNHNPSFAWAIEFYSGGHITTNRSDLLAARLVRELAPQLGR